MGVEQRSNGWLILEALLRSGRTTWPPDPDHEAHWETGVVAVTPRQRHPLR